MWRILINLQKVDYGLPEKIQGLKMCLVEEYF